MEIKELIEIIIFIIAIFTGLLAIFSINEKVKRIDDIKVNKETYETNQRNIISDMDKIYKCLEKVDNKIDENRVRIEEKFETIILKIAEMK